MVRNCSQRLDSFCSLPSTNYLHVSVSTKENNASCVKQLPTLLATPPNCLHFINKTSFFFFTKQFSSQTAGRQTIYKHTEWHMFKLSLIQGLLKLRHVGGPDMTIAIFVTSEKRNRFLKTYRKKKRLVLIKVLYTQTVQ